MKSSASPSASSSAASAKPSPPEATTPTSTSNPSPRPPSASTNPSSSPPARESRAGCGIRVVSGERTGYAYTDDLSSERLLRAARTASLIANGPTKELVTPFNANGNANGRQKPSLYPIPAADSDASLAAKLALVMRADKAARAFDPRIVQVRASYSDELRRILIAASDGTFASDTQPLARLNVFVIAKDGEKTSKGTSGGGGRVELDFFEGAKSPEHHAHEAARQAILQLNAVAAPAGEMEVVLGPGWPGVLLHEAVGHGLEADFNRKKTSAFAGLIGQSVASSKVTVVDNGTMPNRRGSLNVDDEGSPTQETVLIENGILKGYLSDKLSARLMGGASTGSGRRESYQSIPMPRMTNTYMLAGEDAPEDIIRSVKRGLYAVNFGGGQVDITSGKFVFSASEAYLIEDGKITAPVRDATLIGNGPEALKYVSMVGNDLAARRRHRHLRQRRPKRPRRRRHANHQARSDDRGRDRKLTVATGGVIARNERPRELPKTP